MISIEVIINKLLIMSNYLFALKAMISLLKNESTQQL